MIKQTYLTYLIFIINGIIDEGKYKFSFSEIKEQIKNKNIISFLREKVEYVDLSTYEGEKKEEIENALYNVKESMDGYERKKLAIENNGLCLLIAYLTELIQHPEDWDYKK
jgi:hypothetical protein